jgi:hypothetical protein
LSKYDEPRVAAFPVTIVVLVAHHPVSGGEAALQVAEIQL